VGLANTGCPGVFTTGGCWRFRDGWFFWQEILDWISAIGTLLIVIAGMLAMR